MPELPAMFSVLILTLNEERKLPACLASVAGCDDVVVLDSGSTDRTAAIAREAGARVFVNRFENFAQQRNHAHQAIEFRHPWVFHLDADEQMTAELRAECAAYSGDEPLDGCYVAPRMLWEGRWIPRCTDYPAWQARFVKARGFEFVQAGHGQREAPPMRMGRLRAQLSARPVGRRRRRLARQAPPVCAGGGRGLSRGRHGGWRRLRALLAGPALRRRRALKHLSYHLPGRPALRFIYQYLLRGGFLDGRAGYRYCRLLARYEGFASDEISRLRAGRQPGNAMTLPSATSARGVRQPVLLARRTGDGATARRSRRGFGGARLAGDGDRQPRRHRDARRPARPAMAWRSSAWATRWGRRRHLAGKALTTSPFPSPQDGD